MKIWIERALAALRWVWDHIAHGSKVIWDKLRVAFDTVCDPPPRTIRFFFWSAVGVLVSVWLTFAFVNSWFYKPTAAYFASWVGEDTYILPEAEPLPPVATPATPVPSVEVVCQDMSDTPHCVPVQETAEKSTPGTQIEAKVNPAVDKDKTATVPKVKAKERFRKARVRPVKHEPYWPF